MVEGSCTINPQYIQNIAKTPTWLFISKSDQLVNYADFNTVYEALVAAGADTRITALENYNHFETNVGVENTRDLLTWLYGNVNNRI